jgi:hypothetical protein
MRSRVAWVAVVGGVLAAMLVLPGEAKAQTAAGITETGWWTQNPAPNAPAGGFEVAEGPQGPLSVVAFRIRVDATTLTQATLTLSESQVVGTPTLQVCPTTSNWSAASGGAYSSAPTPNCATSVPMTRNSAAATDTADIRKLLGTGPTTVSLMVVPLANAALPAQVPFDATFGSATLLADGDVEPTPAVDNSSSSPSGSGSLGSFDSTSSGGVAPSPDLGATPFPALATTPPPAEQQATAAPAQHVGTFPATGQTGLPAGHGSHQPWGRAIFYVPIALALGALVTLARRRLRTMGWLETT